MAVFANLIFSANRFPGVYDQSQGFFRRWVIVQWNRNFENDPQRILNLKEELYQDEPEKDRVFSFAMSVA